MDKLLSDSAKTEISNKVMDILRAYHISNWHSEPYHQNQNPAEWRYRTIKSWTNTVMNRSGAPANCRQVKRSQTYMFGYLIPRNYMEAMQYDSENKNNKWYDAIKLEMESMLEYKVFKKWDKATFDKHKKVMNPPKGYHGIKVH